MIFIRKYEYLLFFTFLLLSLIFSFDGFSTLIGEKRTSDEAELHSSVFSKAVCVAPEVDQVRDNDPRALSLVEQLRECVISPTTVAGFYSDDSQMSSSKALSSDESQISFLSDLSSDDSEVDAMEETSFAVAISPQAVDSPGSASGRFFAEMPERGLVHFAQTLAPYALGEIMHPLIPASPKSIKVRPRISKAQLERLRKTALRRTRDIQESQKENMPTQSVLLQEREAFQGLMHYINTHLDVYSQATSEDLTPLKYGAVIRAAREYLKIGGYIDRVVSFKDPIRPHFRYILQVDALIDLWKIDDGGRTNLERMKAGSAPIGPDGKSIQIHHLA